MVPTQLEEAVRQTSAEAAITLSEIRAASDQMQRDRTQAEIVTSELMAQDGEVFAKGEQPQQADGEAHDTSNRENVVRIINQVRLGKRFAARPKPHITSHNHLFPAGG